MLEIAIEQCRENGFEQVELGIFEDNERAIHLYEKYGFVKCGIQPKAFKWSRCYEGNVADGGNLRHLLYFIILALDLFCNPEGGAAPSVNSQYSGNDVYHGTVSRILPSYFFDDLLAIFLRKNIITLHMLAKWNHSFVNL